MKGRRWLAMVGSRCKSTSIASRIVRLTSNSSKLPARNQSQAASLVPTSLAPCPLLPAGTARKLSSGITGIAKLHSTLAAHRRGNTLARALYQARIQQIYPRFPFFNHFSTNRKRRHPSPPHQPNSSNNRSPRIENHTLMRVFSPQRGRAFKLACCSLLTTYGDADDTLRTQNESKTIQQ